MSPTAAEFSLKLLSGGKLILAKCPGFESALFIPSIMNNGINLKKVTVSKQKVNNPIKVLQDKNGSNGQPYNNFLQKLKPLANSTPTKLSKSSKENRSCVRSLPTPDIVRRAVVQNENASFAMPSLPQGIKIVPLYRRQTPNTPNKLARIAQSRLESPMAKSHVHSVQNLRNLSNLSNFGTPPILSVSNRENRSCMSSLPTPDIVRRAVVHNKNSSIAMPSLPQGIKIVPLYRHQTPNTPNKLARIAPSRMESPMANSHVHSVQNLRNLSNLSNFGSPPRLSLSNRNNVAMSPNISFLRPMNVPESMKKWRKCITPQRTYIRRKANQPIKTPQKSKSNSVQPLQLTKCGKIRPDYLCNSTKYPLGEGNIKLRRRRLIIDNDVMINPKAFKDQMKNTQDLMRREYSLPKSRRHLISLQKTAFDLLTNSCYHLRMSEKLNGLFRQGCLNKRAATILKYRQLISGIPCLEAD